MFPNPTDEVSITREEVIETAKSEYAYQFLLYYWKQKQMDGGFDMPSELSTEKEFDVKDNEIDISGLNIMSRLQNDLWLQNIGGLTCECKYVKSNINLTQLLCDDDSLPEVYKPYLIVGKKIKFPKGTHADKLTIIYANDGSDIDGEVEVSEEIGAMVRRGLSDIYLGKVNQEDKTNNSSANS